MAVPFAFANLSGNIALAKLDSNFNTPITIGNTSVQLGGTITTLNNMTLSNVTISGGTNNVTETLANVTTLNATSAFITTGDISTANVGNLTLLNALTVPNGGTGMVTLPVNSVLLGNGTSPVASVAPGTAGNVLTSIGGVWTSNAAVVGGVVSSVGATSPLNSSGGANPNISLTGNVSVSNGGTGLTNIPAGNVIIGNGTSALYGIAPGTAGNVLTSIGGVWVSNAAVGGGGGGNVTGSGAYVLANTPSLVNPTITNYTETRYAATITGNAITLDLTNGTFQTITTMVGANAITLPAVGSGKSLTVQIFYSSTPTTLTFSSPSGSLKFSGGGTPAPTLTNTKYDFYSFVSDGTNWYGVQTGANF